MTARPSCAHCRAPLPSPRDEADERLCHDCADLAVWDAACAACDRVPSGRYRYPCPGMFPELAADIA